MNDFNIYKVDTDRILKRFPDEDALKGVTVVTLGYNGDCLVLKDERDILTFVSISPKDPDAYEKMCAVIQYAMYLLPDEMEEYKADDETDIYIVLYFAVNILMKNYPFGEGRIMYDDLVLEKAKADDGYIETRVYYDESGTKCKDMILHKI